MATAAGMAAGAAPAMSRAGRLGRVLHLAAPVLLSAAVFVGSYLGPGFATVLNPTGLSGTQSATCGSTGRPAAT